MFYLRRSKQGNIDDKKENENVLSNQEPKKTHYQMYLKVENYRDHASAWHVNHVCRTLEVLSEK